jgi:aminopeptidase N
MKQNYFRISAFILLLILIQSCKTSQVVGTADSDSKKKPKIKTSAGPYQASNTHYWDLLHTRIDLNFDWAAQEMNATADLRLTPWFYPQQKLVLDAKYMRLNSLEFQENGVWKNLVYQYDSLKLSITLDRTFQRFDTLKLRIRYTAQPNKVKATSSDAITDNRGLYFINPSGSFPFKPRQVWTQGETESASCWFPTLDTPNEKCTQEMLITVEKKQTVISNGKRISTIENPDGTKTEIWRQDIPHAPYLFMVAVGDFSETKDSWKDKPVLYYVEPEFASNAKVVFKNTPEMIDFFSRKLNYPFPWDKYAQVVVRDFVSGAMENTSASVFMEELQCDEFALHDRSWDGIIAHELFHQWFGDIVTCESWANLPLNESFANYSEYLWYEYKLGRAEADIHDEDEEDDYLGEAEERQDALIRFHYEDKEEMFDAHSYNKGGRVLHMLRKMVGDEAFFESYHRYLKRNEFKTVEIHDLRLAFEDVTGQDLNWFFEQWFFKPGHAELKTSHQFSEGMLTIQLEQTQDSTKVAAYRLPLQIEWWIGNKSYRKLITMTKRRETIQIPMELNPNNVIVDAEFQLLGKIFQNKKESEWMHQLQNCPLYKGRSVAFSRLFSSPDNSSDSNFNPFQLPGRIEAFKTALEDSVWAIRMLALSQLSMYAIPDLNAHLSSMEKIASRDAKPQVRAYALSLLASVDLQKYSYLYQEAMTAKSWHVQGNGLKYYLRTEAEDKSARLKKYENNINWEIVKVISDYHLTNQNRDQYEWFKDKLLRLNGRPLYYFIGYFGEYLRLMPSDIKKDGVEWLKKVNAYQKTARIKTVTQKYIKELE